MRPSMMECLKLDWLKLVAVASHPDKCARIGILRVVGTASLQGLGGIGYNLRQCQ